MTGRIQSNTWAVAGLLLSAMVAFGLSIASLAQDSLLFAATGMWALAIVLLPPALQRNYDLLSVWTFVLLSVLLGVTLRGIYMSGEQPSPEIIDELYLRGESPHYFVWPAMALLLGLLSLALGYMSLRPLPRKHVRRSSRIRWLYPMALGVLAVSGLSTLAYIQLTGGLESDLLSAKRAVIPDTDLEGAGYQSYGELRFLASLAIFGHLLVLADVLRPGSRGKGWKLGLAVALLLVACAVPFYASIRSNVGIYLCLSGALCYYSGRKVSKAVLGLGLVAAIGMIYTMTLLRAERSDAEAFAKLNLGGEVVESLFLNRNQIELAKTAHVMAALPETLDYEHGATIARWLYAPIPRTLWPDKPVIHPGPEIGREIYDQPRAGVPPGLVAEMYWNFAWPGVIVGCFVFGLFLRYVYERFRPERGGDPFQAALYVVGPMLLGYEAIGSSLGSGLFRTVFHVGAMLFLLWIIRGPRLDPDT